MLYELKSHLMFELVNKKQCAKHKTCTIYFCSCRYGLLDTCLPKYVLKKLKKNLSKNADMMQSISLSDWPNLPFFIEFLLKFLCLKSNI